ncbi:MAG: polysaccharide deacetylase family protein, partial [Bacillota bacterium]|nr:polysaccharide deacetylase family protein [Bacillota bacterium]
MRRLLAIVALVVFAGCSPVEQVISPPVLTPEPVVLTPVTPVAPEPVLEIPIEEEPILDEPLVGPFETVKHSFWFRRNNTHTQPSLGLKREYIDKYGCIALGQKPGKYIYLTFDEGYEQGFTPQILDVLKELDVPAAFFVTGQYVRSHPHLVKRMAAEGHIIGNHTITHPSLADISEEKMRQELLGLDEMLEPLIGEKTYFMRP